MRKPIAAGEFNVPHSKSTPHRSTIAARNIADLERRAERHLPAPIWHYLQGGADDEWTAVRNTAAFEDFALVPDVLVDVTHVDASVQLLGHRFPLPLILSPTGMSQLFHTDGELAVARAAAAHQILYSLSTMATATIEDVATAGGPRMFQLYCFRDRGLTLELLSRAQAAGYAAICLTVDTPLAGNRERDIATGMTLPPKFTLRTLLQFAAHPRWVLPKIFGRSFELANVTRYAPSVSRQRSGVMEYVNSQMDRSIGWKDLEWLRSNWKGALVMKGVLSPADARRAAEFGCEGVMISNHGGRQLDGAVSPIEQLASIRDAVGDSFSLILDGGVRRGTHVLKAIALGATACAIGRPYLFGLAAAGERGVSRAIKIFREEIERGMALMGCTSLEMLGRRHVRDRVRQMPLAGVGEHSSAPVSATAISALPIGTSFVPSACSEGAH
jgi:L-lactate dehydrogenase (cytochrome)